MVPAAPLSSPARRGWAHARALLRAGDLPGATAVAQLASGRTDWGRIVMTRFGGLAMHTSGVAPHRWVWLEPDQQRALVSPLVMDEFARSWVLRAWSRSVQGSGWRELDLLTWRELDPLNALRP